MIALQTTRTVTVRPPDRATPGAPPADEARVRTSAEEADLTQRARERSPSAWAQIYDLHYRRLFAYCYARTGDRGVAASLAAQAFLRAVAEIDQCRDGPLFVWLYRLTRRVVDAASDARAATQLGNARTPAADDTAVLASHVAQLPNQERETFALRYYAGYTSEEVAAALGEEATIVRRLEARALAAVCRAQKARVSDMRPQADIDIGATKEQVA